jgi:hypothetical protein
MEATRRGFLIQAGAILGLPLVGCKRSPPVPTYCFQQAVKRAAADTKLGVAIVLPADRTLRCTLGHHLVSLAHGGAPEAREILVEAVFVCIERGDLAACIPGARADDTVVVFDETGRFVQGLPLDYDKFADHLIDVARGLVHGDQNERLRDRAEALRKQASPALLRAIADPDPPENYSYLSRGAGQMLPLLIYERLTTRSDTHRTAFASLIQTHVATVEDEGPRRRLPYGIVTQEYEGGCGQPACEEEERERGGVACGMAVATGPSRSFLRFASR